MMLPEIWLWSVWCGWWEKESKLNVFGEYFNGWFQIQIDQGSKKARNAVKLFIIGQNYKQFPRQSPSANVLLPFLRSFNEDEEATASTA